MDRKPRIPRIGDTFVDPIDYAKAAIHLSQQQGSTVRCQPATQKIGDDLPAPVRCKVELLRVTLCHPSESLGLYGNVVANTVIQDPRLASYPKRYIGE